MLFRYAYLYIPTTGPYLRRYAFRCRTCPQAFCEDCLPPGDIDAIGDILPELYVTLI